MLLLLSNSSILTLFIFIPLQQLQPTLPAWYPGLDRRVPRQAIHRHGRPH